jgi:hypothetical protein
MFRVPELGWASISPAMAARVATTKRLESTCRDSVVVVLVFSQGFPCS